VTPGAAELVHHVLVYLYPAADRAAVETADAQDATPGYQCFSGPNTLGAPQPSDMLGGWVPGNSAVNLTPGVGVQVDPGMFAVIQVHYHLGHNHTHDPEAPVMVPPDRTKLELAFAEAAEVPDLRRQYTLPLAQLNLRIPADDDDYSTSYSATPDEIAGGYFDQLYGGDVFVVGVMGHMHLLGKRCDLTKTNTDGVKQTLLEIPKWDFSWQLMYQLVDPIRVVGDDTLKIACTYDNSPDNREANGFETPSGEVRWGEGSFDEMCLAYVMFTDEAPLP
jgi:hypothetical protein